MDTTRWEKGTHTFVGNGCDFIAENAVFQNGKLILCLTNSTNIGYTDVTPPSVLWARTNSTSKITIVFSEEVDQSDAENISKYYITDSQVLVNSAKLLEDLKTVELDVSGINLSNSYLLIVYPIKDRASAPNSSITMARSIIVSQPLGFPIKINCAGPAVLGYLTETKWSPYVEYGSMDGTIRYNDSSLQINGTNENTIYQSEMFNLVGYKINVPNGNYDIKLMFAENYFDSSNARVFDVYLEQYKVINNLDIFSLVGKNTALVKEINNVQVNDGNLEIQFADKINYAVISGIIISPSTTSVGKNKNLSLSEFNLGQNYPNPFNPNTKINFDLPISAKISIYVFDIIGQKVKTLIDANYDAGNYELNFNASQLSSGIYFYKMDAIGQNGQKFSSNKKMILLK
jgi:hypothetical protein